MKFDVLAELVPEMQDEGHFVPSRAAPNGRLCRDGLLGRIRHCKFGLSRKTKSDTALRRHFGVSVPTGLSLDF